MGKNYKEIDEERIFYEKIIKKNSNFLEVLYQLARIYSHYKNYKKTLEIDKKIAELTPLDPFVYYNLACDFALLNDMENAVKNLKIALHLGFENKSYILKDKELKNLRKSKNFEEIKRILKQRNK